MLEHLVFSSTYCVLHVEGAGRESARGHSQSTYSVLGALRTPVHASPVPGEVGLYALFCEARD